MSREGVRVEKCEKRKRERGEGVRGERESREGVQVEKECE